ncbi:unnamed protein product [Lupinus luteus]|uniref:peptidylprolyl isomerase n=1 Tax=Lupinus luteus TaxID=3873 RepID=A0AAV1W0H6_LUPLU
MQTASGTFILSLTPQITAEKVRVDDFIKPSLIRRQLCLSWKLRHGAKDFLKREHINCHPTAAVSGDAQTSSAHFEEFSVSVADINDVKELKISIEVSGNKTQKIFDDVFEKMVAAAQPIPGFRRVKGGKTPDIPKDILLEVLGPFNVYRKVIKQIINSTIGEYVEKERLIVSNDLRVEQSFEDLEASFEAGEKFSFDAVIQLKK